MNTNIMEQNHYQLQHQKRMMQAMRRKRRVTLFNKAHEFATKCNGHVYLLVRYGHRYYCYTSLEHPSWPPPPQHVVSQQMEKNALRLTPFKIQSYPLPYLMDAKTFVPRLQRPSSPSSDDTEDQQPLLEADTFKDGALSPHNKPLPDPRTDSNEDYGHALAISSGKKTRQTGVQTLIRNVSELEKPLGPLLEASDEGEDIPCIYIPS